MNEQTFRRNLAVSASVHFLVVLLFILVPWIGRLLHPSKKPEMITLIDLLALPPPPPPAPPPPKPDEPRPVPVPERPADKARPEPPKIKVNTNKIVRKIEKTPKSAPNQPKLTQEQIRKLLEANIKFSPAGASAGANFSDLSLYYATVRDSMYGAWNQPGTAALGLRAEVTIRVQKNGAISSRKLTRSSGSSQMDNSVMSAVNSAARLRPLPAEVRDPHLDITIEFVVGDRP